MTACFLQGVRFEGSRPSLRHEGLCSWRTDGWQAPWAGLWRSRALRTVVFSTSCTLDWLLAPALVDSHSLLERPRTARPKPSRAWHSGLGCGFTAPLATAAAQAAAADGPSGFAAALSTAVSVAALGRLQPGGSAP